MSFLGAAAGPFLFVKYGNQLKGFRLSSTGDLQRTLILENIRDDVTNILATYNKSYGLILLLVRFDSVDITYMDEEMVIRCEKKVYLRDDCVATQVCLIAGRDLYVGAGIDVEVIENFVEPSDNPTRRNISIAILGMKVKTVRPGLFAITSFVKLKDVLIILTRSELSGLCTVWGVDEVSQSLVWELGLFSASCTLVALPSGDTALAIDETNVSVLTKEGRCGDTNSLRADFGDVTCASVLDYDSILLGFTGGCFRLLHVVNNVARVDEGIVGLAFNGVASSRLTVLPFAKQLVRVQMDEVCRLAAVHESLGVQYFNIEEFNANGDESSASVLCHFNPLVDCIGGLKSVHPILGESSLEESFLLNCSLANTTILYSSSMGKHVSIWNEISLDCSVEVVLFAVCIPSGIALLLSSAAHASSTIYVISDKGNLLRTIESPSSFTILWTNMKSFTVQVTRDSILLFDSALCCLQNLPSASLFKSASCQISHASAAEDVLAVCSHSQIVLLRLTGSRLKPFLVHHCAAEISILHGIEVDCYSSDLLFAVSTWESNSSVDILMLKNATSESLECLLNIPYSSAGVVLPSIRLGCFVPIKSEIATTACLVIPNFEGVYIHHFSRKNPLCLASSHRYNLRGYPASVRPILGLAGGAAFIVETSECTYIFNSPSSTLEFTAHQWSCCPILHSSSSGRMKSVIQIPQVSDKSRYQIVWIDRERILFGDVADDSSWIPLRRWTHPSSLISIDIAKQQNIVVLCKTWAQSELILLNSTTLEVSSKLPFDPATAVRLVLPGIYTPAIMNDRSSLFISLLCDNTSPTSVSSSTVVLRKTSSIVPIGAVSLPCRVISAAAVDGFLLGAVTADRLSIIGWTLSVTKVWILAVVAHHYLNSKSSPETIKTVPGAVFVITSDAVHIFRVNSTNLSIDARFVVSFEGKSPHLIFPLFGSISDSVEKHWFVGVCNQNMLGVWFDMTAQQGGVTPFKGSGDETSVIALTSSKYFPSAVLVWNSSTYLPEVKILTSLDY